MQTQTINVSIPTILLQAVDQQAEKEARTRSGFIQETIRAYIERKTGWEKVFRYGRKQARRSGIKPQDLETVIDDYRSGK